MRSAETRIRRLAFQALFQLDVRGLDAFEEVRDSLLAEEEDPAPAEIDRARALELALLAFEHRAEADEETTRLAPTWPASRQPAVDRSILRLAHYEMTRGGIPPKVVIDEAVELAKEFSTEKSPSFINALLDRVMKRMAGVPDSAPDAVPEPGDAKASTPDSAGG